MNVCVVFTGVCLNSCNCNLESIRRYNSCILHKNCIFFLHVLQIIPVFKFPRRECPYNTVKLNLIQVDYRSNNRSCFNKLTRRVGITQLATLTKYTNIDGLSKSSLGFPSNLPCFLTVLPQSGKWPLRRWLHQFGISSHLCSQTSSQNLPLRLGYTAKRLLSHIGNNGILGFHMLLMRIAKLSIQFLIEVSVY